MLELVVLLQVSKDRDGYGEAEYNLQLASKGLIRTLKTLDSATQVPSGMSVESYRFMCFEGTSFLFCTKFVLYED